MAPSETPLLIFIPRVLSTHKLYCNCSVWPIECGWDWETCYIHLPLLVCSLSGELASLSSSPADGLVWQETAPTCLLCDSAIGTWSSRPSHTCRWLRAQDLDCKFMRHPMLESPSETIPKFRIQRNFHSKEMYPTPAFLWHSFCKCSLWLVCGLEIKSMFV